MKRKRNLLAFCLLVATLILFTAPCEAQVQARRFNFGSHLGVVLITFGDGVCMQISNRNLTEGSPVKLISLSRPQSILRAKVLKKSNEMCQDSGFQQGFDYYSLRLDKKIETLEIALAVVNPAGPISIRKGLASVDLDGDRRREYFRKCTSSEGAHLTVWSGQPLKGKRRWHYYYYLRYDTVPTCRKKDYED